MSRALLDELVPGWEALSSLEFRWAVNACPAQVRADLRAARATHAPKTAPVSLSKRPSAPPAE